MSTRLPWTAKDILKLSPKEWLIFNGTIAFHRLTGLWSYPIPTNGDFEKMTRKDLIYWIYKARYPLKRAVKHSGLEAFFRDQASHRWVLPEGFKPTSTLEISAAGDLMDHEFLSNSAGVLYDGIADTLFDADISMANLECVVFPEGTGDFKLSSEAAPPLIYKLDNFNAATSSRGRSYTFLATAGNHSLDCGEAGVASTLRALKNKGISFNGMNETETDAASATLIEKKGFKVGVISHTFGLNAHKPPKDKPWIVNRSHLNGTVAEADFSTIERQIAHARNNKADLVVAQLHWGLEHEYFPRPAQLEVARHLAEMGVDLLIGHHPHVIQPVEHYRTRRDPDRVVPIYYSLGNLMTPFSHPAFRKSGIARVQLAKGLARDGSTRAYVRSAALAEVFQEIDEQRREIRLIKEPSHASR